MRIILTAILMLCAVAGASAQYEYSRTPWWYTLESGKDMFWQGAYGDALIAFQDARNERRDMYSKMEENLIMFLSTPDARRLNYSLDAIEQLAREDGQLDVLKVLDEVYYRIGRGVLGNSARNVLAQLDRLKSYPEADYWIGEVYRLTGEYDIALRQFGAVLRYEDCLENPNFAVEIVYKMAEIERLRQNYNGMEEHLLSILDRDTLWSEDEGGFVREAMDRTLYTSGVNRFLQMYRYRNAFTERAHRLLGEYYYTSGRHGRAVSHLTFAFLIQNTVIIEEAIAASFDFKFTSLEELMMELERRKDVKEYMAERDYYRTIYYLAAALYANSREMPARELWDFLSGRAEAGEWQGRARTQLSSPSIDSPAG